MRSSRGDLKDGRMVRRGEVGNWQGLLFGERRGWAFSGLCLVPGLGDGILFCLFAYPLSAGFLDFPNTKSSFSLSYSLTSFSSIFTLLLFSIRKERVSIFKNKSKFNGWSQL